MLLLRIEKRHMFQIGTHIVFQPEKNFGRNFFFSRQLLFSKVDAAPWNLRPIKSDFAPNTKSATDRWPDTICHYEKNIQNLDESFSPFSNKYE